MPPEITMENLPSPNVIDIIALIICAFCIFQGFRRGLSGELARFASVAIAFTLGMVVYRPFGSWLTESEYIRLSEQSAFALAFFITVLGAVAVMIIIRFVLRRIMKIVFEPVIDKIGGCIAGFLRAVIFILIIFVMMNMWPHEYLNRLFGEDSVIGSSVIKYMPSIREKAEEINAPSLLSKEKKESDHVVSPRERRRRRE